MLIAFTGPRRCGKDTCADIAARIINDYWSTPPVDSLSPKPIKKFSFAKRLKEACVNMFGLDMDIANGIIPSGSQVKDAKDIETWLRFDMFGELEGLARKSVEARSFDERLTYRHLFQLFGTEIMRSFMPNIWVDIVENELKQADRCGLISDCRFQNEAEMVIRNGGVIVKIVRDECIASTHASEQGLPNSLIHSCIVNNGSLEYLEESVRNVIDNFILDVTR